MANETNGIQDGQSTLSRLMQLPRQQSGMAELMQLPGGQPQSPIGPTNPIQSGLAPQANTDPDQVLTQALASQTKMSNEETPIQLSRARSVADVIRQKIAEEANIQRPNVSLGYDPHFEKVTGAGSFLKDAGKGLLWFLSSLPQARAMQEVRYQHAMVPYETEMSAKAKQIAELTALQKQEEEPIASLSSLGPKSMVGYGRGASGTAAEQKTTGQLRHWQNQDANAMNRIAETHRHNIQGELARLKVLEETGDQHAIERQELKVRMAVAGMEVDAKNYATDAGLYEDESKTYTQTQIANMVQSAGLQKAHPLLSSGGYLTSPQVAIPPKPSRPVRPSRSGGQGSVQVKDPRGVVHAFPDQKSADAFKRAAGIN